ncbi:hypothetical protein C8Q74DRAFT_273124 [Fomes fomentarius]|nr:hypothetical protein C8Q74DRAFT_273124 [Fomes fomentarius]
MSGKTLSNGTLSLRFMQNAQRAKLQAQVEAEQANIKDDAEWSVAQDVREAWGIGGWSHSNDEVQHESSYLPFIFQSDFGEGSSSNSQVNSGLKYRGRRTFNARGKEVGFQETKQKVENSEEGTLTGEHQADSQGKSVNTDDKPRSRFEKHLTSISGFTAPLSTRRDEQKPRTKTAQMLIREDISVHPPESLRPTSTLPAMGFVKPAGVDEPIPPIRKAAAESRKRDRDQDSVADRPSSEGKKRKKKQTGP